MSLSERTQHLKKLVSSLSVSTLLTSNGGYSVKKIDKFIPKIDKKEVKNANLVMFPEFSKFHLSIARGIHTQDKISTSDVKKEDFIF